ncbi:LuxR C-terminal-related transcriptional regulator [Nonomuraea longispora]
MSSKQIPAQLFLSPRTVEYHLYKPATEDDML